MEIERKFLLEKLPFELENVAKYEKHELQQSYISRRPTIRIRKSDDEYILTVKGEGDIAKEEFELPMTQEQYELLRRKAEPREVVKTRYIIPLQNDLRAEADVYHAELEGMMTVEVEFVSMEQAEGFVPPEWFGKDVSYDRRYSNANLSLHGIPK